MEKHPENTAVERGNTALERLWNRDYCIAMAGNFLLFFSFYLLTPLLPIYLDAQFGADKAVSRFLSPEGNRSLTAR